MERSIGLSCGGEIPKIHRFRRGASSADCQNRIPLHPGVREKRMKQCFDLLSTVGPKCLTTPVRYYLRFTRGIAIKTGAGGMVEATAGHLIFIDDCGSRFFLALRSSDFSEGLPIR